MAIILHPQISCDNFSAVTKKFEKGRQGHINEGSSSLFMPITLVTDVVKASYFNVKNGI